VKPFESHLATLVATADLENGPAAELADRNFSRAQDTDRYGSLLAFLEVSDPEKLAPVFVGPRKEGEQVLDFADATAVENGPQARPDAFDELNIGVGTCSSVRGLTGT
jgi:hypothetical protein